MGIGYRIKEARERLGLTQTELGSLVGVTGSAITNYEKETSHPKEQIIYKLMETLNVDANYLFQDAVKVRTQQNDVNLAEYDMVKKYRDLDPHGKEMVDFTLQKEWERSTFYENIDEVEKYRRAQKYYDSVLANKKRVTVDDLIAPFPDEDAPPKTLSQLADDLLNAAHAIENASEEDKRFDDDIMDDENF